MVEFHLISFMSDFNESWAGEANSEHGHRPMDNNVALILWAVLRMHDHMDKQFRNLHTEIHKNMATLAEEIQSVKDTFTSSLETLDASIQAAADRVIATINSGDPAGAVASLEEFKTSMSDSVAAEKAKVDAIDVPVEPAP